MSWAFQSAATARAAYLRALVVAQQWTHTAHVTGNARHQETALICGRIAQEKAALLAELEANAGTERGMATDIQMLSQPEFC